MNLSNDNADYKYLSNAHSLESSIGIVATKNGHELKDTLRSSVNSSSSAATGALEAEVAQRESPHFRRGNNSSLFYGANNLEEPSITKLGAISDSNSRATSSKDFVTEKPLTLSSEKHEVVFIEGNLSDYQRLVAGIRPNQEVFVLNSNQDGLLQISSILAQEHNVSAMHILSHGSAGMLQLGATTLSEDNLGFYTDVLRGWATSFMSGADILLYGCDVAMGATGQSFVKDLSQLTKADVAASTDLTGSAVLGGNWTLEFTTGAITAKAIAQTSYTHTLGTIALLNSTLAFSDDSLFGENNTLTLSLSDDRNSLLIKDTQNEIQIADGSGGSVTRIDNQTVSTSFYTTFFGIKSSVFSNLEIQGGKGTDAVTFSGDLSLSGGNVSVETEQIIVNPNITIATQKTYKRFLDFSNKSGDINFNAKEIQINSGAKLLTNADKPEDAGKISLIAKDAKKDVSNFATIETTAKITIDNATLKGGDIKITTEASSKNRFLDADNLGNTALNVLGLDVNGILAASRQTAATSSILLGKGSQIDAANLVLSALATSDTAANTLGIVVGVAYGRADATAKITVSEEVAITTREALTIQSKTDTLVNVTVSTNPVGKNLAPVALTLAVSQANIESTTEVKKGATLTVGGNLKVTATNQKKFTTSAAGAAYDNGSAGFSVAISDVTSRTNALMDGQATVTGNVLIQAESGLDEKSPVNTTTASAGVSGSSLVETIKDAVTNDIPAVIDKIKQKLGKDVPPRDAKSGAGSNSALGLAAAWAQASYIDDTTARIGSDAIVKTKGSLDLQARIHDVPKISATGIVNSDKLDAKGGNTKDNSVSAAITLGKYNHTVNAYISENAEVDASGTLNVTSKLDLPNPAISQWTLTSIPSNVGGLVTGGAYTSWTKSLAVGSKTAIAGSVNSLTVNNSNQAFIAEKAKINQNTAYRSGSQTVNVNAFTKIETLSYAGTTDPVDTIKSLFSPSQHPGAAGVGVSYLGVAYNNTTKATIGKDVKLYAAQLDVNAKNDSINISIAVSGGWAGKFGANLTFAKAEFKNLTLAQISGNTQIEVVSGNINVRAVDNLKHWSASGGVTFGQNVGVGGSATVNEITRDTQAIIGQQDAFVEGNYVRSIGGNIALNAINAGSITSLSLAGSYANGESGGSGESGEQGSGQFGIALSGDASLNTINDITQAVISNANIIETTTIRAVGLDLDASNTSNIFAFSGSAALSRASQTSIGVAGSYSQNTLNGTTAAFINGSTVSFPGANPESQLRLKAANTQTIRAIAVGGSGAPSSNGLALAGSASVNAINQKNLAYIANNSKIQKVGHISLEAVDSSQIASLAGVLTVGGVASGGASLSKNGINSTTSTYIKESDVDGVGNISLNAETKSKISSISAALGVSKSGLAAAVAVSLNNIANTTESTLANKKIQAKGTITVSASDNSIIEVIAGNLAGGGDVGAGGSFAKNSVKNTIRTMAEDSQVESEQSVNFVAKAETTIKAAAAGVAASKVGAIGGGMAINTINNTVDAHVKQGAVRAKGTEIKLDAQDTSTIQSLAGQVALSGGKGVGAGAAYNEINNAISAYAANTTLEGQGGNTNIALNAKANATIETLAVSGSGGGGISGAGSIAVNNMKNTVESYISDSIVKTSGNLNVIAENTGKVTVIAGGVAIGGNGVGGAVVVNVMDNPTTARVSGSILKINQAITVKASSNEAVDAKTVGGGFGAGVSFAGAASINTIKGTTSALINGNTTINWGDDDLGKGGDITVQAVDTTKITAISGGVSGSGVAAIGAGIDISDIRKPTTAGIASGSQVRTAGKVNVYAFSERSIDSTAVAASAAGGFGVSGGVSIINLGAPILNRQVDANGKPLSAKGALGDTASRIDEILSKAPIAKAVVSTVFDFVSALPSETFAYIGGTVKTGGSINVNADARASANAVAGALGVGLKLGAGGAVTFVNVKNFAEASILENADLTAKDGVAITSSANVNDGGQNITSVAGAGGFVGLGAAVSFMDVDNSAIADVRNNARITTTDRLVVRANTNATLDVRGWGAQFGAVAGGLVWVDAILKGQTEASLGSRVQVNTGSYLDIHAESKNSVKTNAIAASGGIAAAAGAVSNATATPNVKAFIGDNSQVATGSIEVYAKGLGTVTADSKGVTSGAVTSGASLAKATWTPTIQASVGQDATVTAQGYIRIWALDNYSSADKPEVDRVVIARVTPPAKVDVIGKVGSQATVNITADTSTLINDRAKLKAKDELTLLAKSRNVPDAKVTAESTSYLFSREGIRVDARITNNTQTITGGGVILESGKDLTLLSDSDNGSGTHLMTIKGKTGGLLSNSTATIDFRLTNVTRTVLGSTNRLTSGGTLALDALNRINARTDVEQRIGGIWSGDITAQNFIEVDSQTSQTVGYDSALKANKVRLRAEDVEVDLYDRAFAESSFGFNNAYAFFDKIDVSSTVKLAQGATIESASEANLIARQAKVLVEADAFASKTKEFRRAHNKINSNFNAQVVTETGSKITAGTLNVTAENNRIDYVRRLPENAYLQSGKLEESGSINRSNSINFNSDVTLLPTLYSLNIDANSNITGNNTISYEVDPRNSPNSIVVSGLDDRFSLVKFRADRVSGAATLKVAPKIEITNASKRTLSIEFLVPTNPSNFQSFDMNNKSFTIATYVTPEINIRNTGSDTLLGVIDTLPVRGGQFSNEATFSAAGGTVRVDNPGGSILRYASRFADSGTIKAQNIELTARDSIQDIELYTAETQGRVGSISLKSGRDIKILGVHGLERHRDYSVMDVNLSVEAGGDLYMLLNNAQQQTFTGYGPTLTGRYNFKKLQVNGSKNVWKAGSQVITNGL